MRLEVLREPQCQGKSVGQTTVSHTTWSVSPSCHLSYNFRWNCCHLSYVCILELNTIVDTLQKYIDYGNIINLASSLKIRIHTLYPWNKNLPSKFELNRISFEYVGNKQTNEERDWTISKEEYLWGWWLYCMCLVHQTILYKIFW